MKTTVSEGNSEKIRALIAAALNSPSIEGIILIVNVRVRISI
jgi:hypothetical protein